MPGRGVRLPRLPAASPTRSATTTSSRGSPGSRSSSPEGLTPRPPPRCPKAHLHLHFTGSMRHATLLELAERDGIALPDSLVSEWPPRAVGGRREGLVPLPAALRRRPLGAAHRGRRTPAGAGGRRGRRPRRRPVAGDPGRPERVRRPVRRDHRLHRPGARRASATPRERTGLGMAVVIAANRTRHPLDARTLARLAAQYAGRGVVGFGLSNDERRGTHRRLRAGVRDRRAGRADAGAARRRAARARPASGPASTRCTPTGSATASASAEDPALLDRIVAGRASPWRSARSPTSRSASTPT